MFLIKWKKLLRRFKMCLLSLQDATFWEGCYRQMESRMGFFYHGSSSVVLKNCVEEFMLLKIDKFPN